jgi:hypothetical protein
MCGFQGRKENIYEMTMTYDEVVKIVSEREVTQEEYAARCESVWAKRKVHSEMQT